VASGSDSGEAAQARHSSNGATSVRFAAPPNEWADLGRFQPADSLT
jgi:hypothetical protein